MNKKCPNCQKEFEQPKGTREKIYCSNLCRASYNQKMKALTVDLNKYFPNDIRKNISNDLAEVGMIVTKKTEKGIEYIKAFTQEWFDVINLKLPKTQIKDLNQTTNEIKPQEQQKTNYTVDTKVKSFEQLLADAKAGKLDLQEFTKVKLSAAQSELILRKQKESNQ